MNIIYSVIFNLLNSSIKIQEYTSLRLVSYELFNLQICRHLRYKQIFVYLRVLLSHIFKRRKEAPKSFIILGIEDAVYASCALKRYWVT